MNGKINSAEIEIAMTSKLAVFGEELINRTPEQKTQALNAHASRLLERVERNLRFNITPKAAAERGMRQLGWLK